MRWSCAKMALWLMPLVKLASIPALNGPAGARMIPCGVPHPCAPAIPIPMTPLMPQSNGLCMQSTPLTAWAAIPQTAGLATTAEPKINEFSASTTGTDVEYVEVFGDPDTDYTAYTLLEIEGDFSGTATGTVDEVISLGTTDANGFYLASLPANAFENGTISLLLVENFTGALGDDLDTDDDGSLDSTPWDAVVDAVAVNDGGAGDLTYGVPALGPNYDGVSRFAPGGASRIPDGFDTDAASDWVRNDFDLAGIPGFAGTIGVGEAYNTPGAPNEVYVPPPEACGDPFTTIYDVQGSGAASPLVGTTVRLRAWWSAISKTMAHSTAAT